MSKLNQLARMTTFVRTAGGSRIAGKVILGASLISFALGLNSYVASFRAQQQVEFRKRQLKLPVYKLTEEQMVNPPWNHDNLGTWLYRRVQVVGRPIHRLSMNIPHWEMDTFGYESVVPLVTREDKNYKNRHGLLFSLGFVPAPVANPTNRLRIQRVDRQRFVGFVSKLSELSNDQYFNGNAYQSGRKLFNNADLQDMGKTSQLLNREQASVAVIQKLHETGSYDERDSTRRSCSADASEPYPWAKTEAGALQLGKMPWDHRNEAKGYFLGGVFGVLVGASIF